jgi:hypothetical protein
MIVSDNDATLLGICYVVQHVLAQPLLEVRAMAFKQHLNTPEKFV